MKRLIIYIFSCFMLLSGCSTDSEMLPVITEPEYVINILSEDSENRTGILAGDVTGQEESINKSVVEYMELDGWLGDYGFSEWWAHNSDINAFMHYRITIYKGEDALYYADIEIDGYQTMDRIRAIVQGDEENINIIFSSYLPDILHERYEKGDILLRLRKYREDILTYWGKLEPVLNYNMQSGRHFTFLNEMSEVTLHPAYVAILASIEVNEWPGFLEIDLLDIDEDGSPELLLYLGTSYYLYTLVDNEAVCLIETENIGYLGNSSGNGLIVYENESGKRLLAEGIWVYGVSAYGFHYSVYNLEEGTLNRIIYIEEGYTRDEDWLIEYRGENFNKSLIITEPAPEFMGRLEGGDYLFYYYIINDVPVSKEDYDKAVSTVCGEKVLYDKYIESIPPMISKE